MKLLSASLLLLSFAFYVDGFAVHRRFKRGQQRYENVVNFPTQQSSTSIEMEPSETVYKKTVRTYHVQPTVVKKVITYPGGTIDGGTLDLSNLDNMNTDTVSLGGSSSFRVIRGPTVRRRRFRVIQGRPTVRMNGFGGRSGRIIIE